MTQKHKFLAPMIMLNTRITAEDFSGTQAVEEVWGIKSMVQIGET